MSTRFSLFILHLYIVMCYASFVSRMERFISSFFLYLLAFPTDFLTEEKEGVEFKLNVYKNVV